MYSYEAERADEYIHGDFKLKKHFDMYSITYKDNSALQPFDRRCRMYLGFIFLLALYVPPFKHVKDKM